MLSPLGNCEHCRACLVAVPAWSSHPGSRSDLWGVPPVISTGPRAHDRVARERDGQTEFPRVAAGGPALGTVLIDLLSLFHFARFTLLSRPRQPHANSQTDRRLLVGDPAAPTSAPSRPAEGAGLPGHRNGSARPSWPSWPRTRRGLTGLRPQLPSGRPSPGASEGASVQPRLDGPSPSQEIKFPRAECDLLGRGAATRGPSELSLVRFSEEAELQVASGQGEREPPGK